MTTCMHSHPSRSVRPRRLLALMLCVLLLCPAHTAWADPGQKMSEKFDVSTQLESSLTTVKEYAALLMEYAEAGYAPGSDRIVNDA